MKRLSIASLACLLLALPAQAQLMDYVQKPDDSFTWNLKETIESESGKAYRIEMVSQTWQGIKWDHTLMIYLPADSKPADTMLLWNDGGTPNPVKSLMAFELSKRSKVPVAFLYGIPKQPLFGGKKEDALIAETFVQYLKTKDGSWPLLFPMVKSLVRGMDAIQAFSKNEWKQEIKSFVVSGASKRGWTSWLTGVADPRVKAISPFVIDTLNMAKQLPHQVEAFGKPSEMIHDYVERGLVPFPPGEDAQNLWKMVDPWTYRDKLTLPKMIVNGANDPYWSQDALNIYWDDLKGDKWILYVPNAGHGLLQEYANGSKDRNRALATLSMFARKQVLNQPMPKLSWKHDDFEGKLRLTVDSSPVPKAVRLWVADAATQDFRKSVWTEKEVAASKEKGQFVGTVELPKSGWRAFFAEFEYEEEGRTYFLSTQLRVKEAAK